MSDKYRKNQVIFAIRKLFKITEQAEVLKALNLDRSDSYRTYLAVLKLSKGNLKEFYNYLEKAEKDYRDVLWWAEYDGKDRNKKIQEPYKEMLS